MKASLKAINSSIEMVSNGLLQLEAYSVIGIPTPRLVDIAARLNAQKHLLDNLLEPMKVAIKTEADALEVSEVKGFVYKAVIRHVAKTVLDTHAVKTWLGKKLPKFMTTRQEITVSFEIEG